MAKSSAEKSPTPSHEESPSPSPSPSGQEGSSPASARASHSDPPPFIADPGPGFDPEAAPPLEQPPPLEEPQPALLIEWEEDTIKALLMMKGRALHAGIGVADRDWQYTEIDLAAIAPPLTRIANRYEPVQRLARHADPLLLMMAFGGYGVRSLEERATVLRALAEEDTEIIAPLDEVEAEAMAQRQAPAPPPAAPRQQFATAAPGPAAAPPAAPVQPAPPAPDPRPGEAGVDPEALNWDVPRR